MSCDGTWNAPDQAIAGKPCPTNITKLALSIASEDCAGARQCAYHHPGVVTSRGERLGGGASGFGPSRNVFDAYRFLIDNYEDGDELYFFGFSRDVFTARSLAGLVRNCGILRRENADRIDEAWSLYRSSAGQPSGVASTLFCRAYSYEPRIHFLGMWDTVGTRGIPALGSRWLQPIAKWLNHRSESHDAKLSTWVDGAFHALAIDEQRAVLEPTLRHQQPGAEDQEPKQELKQVWFPRVHCDVGGGYPDTSLSGMPLLWMAERTPDYGLEFVPGAFSSHGPARMIAGESIDFQVAPQPTAKPHRSWGKVYRLFKPVDRPIGAVASEDSHFDGLEYLSTTAQSRHDEDPYRPSGVGDYLATPDNVHLEPTPEKPGRPGTPSAPSAADTPPRSIEASRHVRLTQNKGVSTCLLHKLRQARPSHPRRNGPQGETGPRRRSGTGGKRSKLEPRIEQILPLPLSSWR